ncbi:MAG TPA: reverse transcriptase-like protein [Candidatus Saccharimonadales bacterium]
MKTLKLDHELANLIRAGKKTSTWRIFDDKDLRVNDDVELVDKVDASDPTSWNVFSTARIDRVIEKRIGDIVESDFEGEKYVSLNEMLQTYRNYYGPNVTLKTPIKMIHFSLTKKAEVGDSSVSNTVPKLLEAKMYADGGSRGNPGPSASGFVILNLDDQVVVKEGIYLGVTTNNQAEYQALKLGLEEARRMGIQEISVYMDSLLVINQMKGIFKVKNRDLWPIHEAIKQIATGFKHITYTHVPRELNKLADGAVNEALDQAAARQ